MDILSVLDDFQREAKRNAELRAKLLATREEKNQIEAFCKIARAYGMKSTRWI